ncbi:plasmid mobilization relaxosome protein MobC [Alteromonadaceae bacterium M269]|nr:plasmid mobilization relaxosome protein MobC [Alteromonadaceae bacterium M269]
MLALNSEILGLPLDATMTFRLPLSLKEQLTQEARMLGISNSAYVVMRLADSGVQRKLADIFMLQQQRTEYARILRALGQSRIANNLNQIAYQLNTGTLIFTPDIAAQINEAYEAIMTIRSLLIEGMGVKLQ